MSAHSCVVLYGNSVFLAGIKAELELDPGIELLAADSRSTDILDKIRYHQPCALLFDLAEGQPDFVVALLREQPSLLLIAVDPARDELFILSGTSQQALSTADLVNIICPNNLHQAISGQETNY
jgi:hypothetical protein